MSSLTQLVGSEIILVNVDNMRLIFINKNAERIDLGNYSTQEEANKKIKNFLTELGYNSPYWRIAMFSDRYVYDVGSWSEFFHLYLGDEDGNKEVWEE